MTKGTYMGLTLFGWLGFLLCLGWIIFDGPKFVGGDVYDQTIDSLNQLNHESQIRAIRLVEINDSLKGEQTRRIDSAAARQTQHTQNADDYEIKTLFINSANDSTYIKYIRTRQPPADF